MRTAQAATDRRSLFGDGNLNDLVRVHPRYACTERDGGRLPMGMSNTWLAGALLLPLSASAQVTVSGGPGLDYQASVIRPWNAPQSRIVVFERLDAGLSGDLWVTRSDDEGATWNFPTIAVGTAANERHAALVQTGESLYQLFYLKDEGGSSFRIHRASSGDGAAFTGHGRVELGWAVAGEINPHVIREDDGTLLMTYHRLSGAAYIARSADAGLTWDQDRVQVSVGNAALPRLAHRPDDDTYLLVYQTNPGNNQLRLWASTTNDPSDWSAAPIEIVTDGNNHDALPVVLGDGRFALFWARVADGNFQIFSMQSPDGQEWDDMRQLTSRPNLANVQPHALALAAGETDLYWGAAQDAAGSDYDIVRQIIAFTDIFRDGFEP